MMSAQRDWRRRLPTLTYPAISAGTAAPLLGRHVEAPLFLVLRDLTGILLPSRAAPVLALHRSSALPSKSRSRPAGSLCGSPDS